MPALNLHFRKFAAPIALAAVTMLSSLSANAQASYATGHITAVTSTTNGLMIMLDVAVPTNCTGTPFGWLLIPETNKTMVTLVMGLYLRDGFNSDVVTVYTGGIGSVGFCVIGQVQPN